MKRWRKLWVFFVLGSAIIVNAGEYEENQILHADCGHKLDKFYYDVGSRVDRVRLTVDNEAIRQEAETLDQALRREYLALEKKRQMLDRKLYLPNPVESYLFCIENIEDAPATVYGWVGFNSILFEWNDKTTFELPLTSFRHARYLKKYDFNCEPSPAIVVSGRQSGESIVVSEKEPERIPSGEAKLIVSGLDCDKPGAPTQIVLRIYGHEIYRGPNPFRKNGWTKHVFKIPAHVLQKPETEKRIFIHSNLKSFQKEIQHFGETSKVRADQLVHKASQYPTLPKKVIKHNTDAFVRAIDVENASYREELFAYPGNYIDMGHAALMCGELNVNLVSLLVVRSQRPHEIPGVLRPFAEEASFPFIVWGSLPSFLDKDIISYRYYFDHKALERDIDHFIKCFSSFPNFCGIQVDEPHMMEARPDFQKFRITPEYQEALKTFSGDEELFKTDLMAKQMRYIFDSFTRRGLFASIVVMNKNMDEPQSSSYVALGKVLPYIGTDIYLNGGIGEAFAMQLMKNAAKGKAIMWPGSGFSCRTPDAFQRSLATGLAFADGIHVWTYTYCSKYRDPHFFWRYGGKRDDVDDRGRKVLSSWHPDYWYILKSCFAQAANNDAFLRERESLAQVALVLSERGMMEAAKNKNCLAIWDKGLAAYTQLINQGVPVDVIFVENLTPKRLNRYRELVVIEAGDLELPKFDGKVHRTVPDTLLPNTLPINIKNLPHGVACALHKMGHGYIVNLIDYQDGRTVSGHSLKSKLPGKWVVYDASGTKLTLSPAALDTLSLPAFKVHQLLTIRTEER